MLFRQVALDHRRHAHRTAATSPSPSRPTRWSPIARDQLLGILTADCAPILLADPEAGVIGAAHAGWKGARAASSMAPSCAMVALGADPTRIRAAIGPTISAANYEVGPDTAAQIIALDKSAAEPRSLSPTARTASISTFPASLAEQLFGAGVGLVDDLGICTYAEPGKATSRTATPRITGIGTGRQIARHRVSR